MSALKRYWRIALGIVVIAVLIIAPMYLNRYGLFILSQWAVMTIAAMGLNLTLGYAGQVSLCLLYTSPSPRDRTRSRMPSSA